MRALIRAFDGVLRRAFGVFEFCDEPTCLFRLQVSRVPRIIHLPDGDIPAGAQVVLLHLWNEHMLTITSIGPDVGWAMETYRMMISSLRAVACQIQHDPRLAGVQAVGGMTVLVPSPDDPGGGGLIRHLGFTVFPYSGSLGRFGEFWENFYTWWIMWAYNVESVRRRQLLRLRRSELWMSVEAFLRRYSDRR